MPGKRKSKNVLRIGLPCPTCGESIKEGQKTKVVNGKKYHATKKCLPEATNPNSSL